MHIMVWAGIMMMAARYVVANGTMTKYIGEVLLPHVRLFRGAVGDKFVFMDDFSESCSIFQRLMANKNCRQVAGLPPKTSHPCTHRGINCLNSCWIMLCKVWYDVWNVASHYGGHIPY
ncbi:hypothetical protein TNCV_3426421 [Trichonephila clavipes]|nr:hypothetical protein TNCV_3426421 [Trichonephila clavipes]